MFTGMKSLKQTVSEARPESRWPRFLDPLTSLIRPRKRGELRAGVFDEVRVVRNPLRDADLEIIPSVEPMESLEVRRGASRPSRMESVREVV